MPWRARRSSLELMACRLSPGGSPRSLRSVSQAESEQLPRSPCTNLCDLGFFRSIDTRLSKLRSCAMPTFIKQIEGACEVGAGERARGVWIVDAGVGLTGAGQSGGSWRAA